MSKEFDLICIGGGSGGIQQRCRVRAATALGRRRGGWSFGQPVPDAVYHPRDFRRNRAPVEQSARALPARTGLICGLH